MTGDGFSRACIVAGVLAVLAASAPGAVGSAGADDPHVAPPWTYDATEPVHVEDVAARMRDERVTAAVAEHRFRVDRAASVLQQSAERRWPATFGGLWIDPAAFTVQVAFTADAVANVAVLAGEFPYPAELRPVAVVRSRADLLALRQRLDADRAVVGAAYGRFDLDVDVPANQTVIRLARVTDDVRRRLLATYGPALRVDVGLAAPHACEPRACHPTMYGGLHVEQGTQSCTTAFTAAIASYRYALSAGHCYKHGGVAEATQSGTYYGAMTSYQLSGRVDAERIRNLSGGSWRESSKFYLYDGLPRDVTAYKRHADIVVGAYLGKTGRGTGTNRGYVKSTTFSPDYVPNASNFVIADMCSDVGDSGGPVWNGNTAFGIASGGVVGTCRMQSGYPNTGYRTIFGSIEYAISALGVTLLSGVNAAPVANFSGSCDLLMRCSFDSRPSDDDDGAVRSWSWDFGDGSTSTAEMPTHDYGTPGTYTVRLTVQDNDGTASATITRTVTNGVSF